VLTILIAIIFSLWTMQYHENSLSHLRSKA